MVAKIDRIQLASGVNAMLGAWLVISPWTLSYVQEYAATGNSILIGVVVATLGIARAYGAYRSSWLSWINALIGGWAVAAPWILTYGHDAARTNSVVVGVAVLVLAAWSATARPAGSETP